MLRMLSSKIDLRVALLLFFIFGAIGAVAFGAAVLDGERETRRFGPLGPAAVTIAEIPDTMRDLMHEDTAMRAFAANRFADRPAGWTFAPGAALEGYVLLSRHDGDAKSHVVELVDLSDGSVKHEWRPNAEALLANAPRESRIAEFTNWTNEHYRIIHPYLTDNARLIVKDHQSFLYALDACSNAIWSQENVLMHHSTEPDGEGGYWVPGYIEPNDIYRVDDDFIEDSMTHIGADGDVIENIAAARIFLRHGMEYSLFTAGRYQPDPLHLNDIQPVLSDGPYWKKGDLFLSFRHQSMIMLYRPASDEIIWKRQGPWLAQHDVDILDDHRIAVFNNRAYDKGTGARVHNTNQITVYDFATGEVGNPWALATETPEIKTLFEGLFDALPEDALLIEEENSGRLVIVNKRGDTIAEFINKGADGNVYRLGWSRFMPKHQGDTALEALVSTADCG